MAQWTQLHEPEIGCRHAVSTLGGMWPVDNIYLNSLSLRFYKHFQYVKQ